MENKKNVTVRELVDLLNAEDNMTGGVTGKERILALCVNGKYYGHVTVAKLDGWGDGLITDVCLELNVTDDGVKTEYVKLAEAVRKFEDINLLASEIESLDCNSGVETVDDLTEFLEQELEYANN